MGFSVCVRTRLGNVFAYKSEGAAAFRLLNKRKKYRIGFSRGPFQAALPTWDPVLTQIL